MLCMLVTQTTFCHQSMERLHRRHNTSASGINIQSLYVFSRFCVFCVNSNPTKGVGAPEEIHPNDLIQSTQHGSFVPRHRIPFLSSTITEGEGRLYSQLSARLQDVVVWLSSQVI